MICGHTFASTAIASGQGLPMIGKLLGHTQVQTTARYAHLAADPIKSAADQVASNIAAHDRACACSLYSHVTQSGTWNNATVKAIARAFCWREVLENGTHVTVAEIAANETYVG
jgi:hypothetical protein